MATSVQAAMHLPALASVCDLPLGASGRIEAVDLPHEAAARLEGLGICLGRVIRLVKRGEPNILHVYGTRIGLAADLARRIFVNPSL